MDAPRERSHAIPASRRDVEAALAVHLEKRGRGEERARFTALARLVAAWFHHDFHARLDGLKRDYEAFDPDRIAADAAGSGGGAAPLSQPEAVGERFTAALGGVLEKGHYNLLSQSDIDFALGASTLFPIDVEIDFELFDHLMVYARGLRRQADDIPSWLGLRKRRVEFEMYERVCVCLRLRQPPPSARIAQDCVPGKIVLKLFRNIPRADLEMLLPNTRLKMRMIDKLLIGVPAVVGGVPVAAKLAPAVVALAVLVGVQRAHIDQLEIIAGLSGLFGLGLFLFRQWDKFKSRKLHFLKMLSENLYFRNLDNNEGVLTRLVDEAEEEECKEALIAYVLALCEPGLDAAAIDARAEAWLAETFGVDVDFQIDDALDKLVDLGVVRRDDSGAITAEPLGRALAEIDRRWDALYSFSGSSADASSPLDADESHA